MVKADRWWERWDQPENRDRVQRFWKENPDQVARREQFYEVVRALQQQHGFQSVLDCGCGTAWDYPFFTSLGLAYHGVDVTEEMLTQARTQFAGIQVEVGDILNLPFQAVSHPFVVCNAVLPHLPAEILPGAFRELWRITAQVLVVRLFGVGKVPGNKSFVSTGGFLLNWFQLTRWLEIAQEAGLPQPVAKIAESSALRDACILIFTRRADA